MANSTNINREFIANELAEAAEVLRLAGQKVRQAKAPMSEAELGARLWPQGFVKPPPKPPQR